VYPERKVMMLSSCFMLPLHPDDSPAASSVMLWHHIVAAQIEMDSKT
jgi:hypothetical protein